jgi:hypothetical protein
MAIPPTHGIWLDCGLLRAYMGVVTAMLLLLFPEEEIRRSVCLLKELLVSYAFQAIYFGSKIIC